jgi:hypothetical protein
MRDERTKLLTFVNTWMDGVHPNLDKFWQKWRMSSRKSGRTEMRGKGKNRELGLDEGFI